MKFRPSNNFQTNRQNLVANLIQLATTSTEKIIKETTNTNINTKDMRVIANSNNNLNCVTGLNNLGNTCFFNSILQNLAQTPFLDDLLSEAIKSQNSSFSIRHNDDYDSELTDFEEEDGENRNYNKKSSSSEEEEESGDSASEDSSSKIENKNKQTVYHRSIKVEELILQLKEPNGLLTNHLLNTIRSMTQPMTAVVNPAALFSSLCKKCPTFKGFQQHDSHELLRNLLDGIKTEELKRRQSAILEHFKINSSGSKTLDDLLKKKIKRYGRLSSYTLIDSLFGGHLLSTIVCEECKNCTQRVEPFLDLSLPIVDNHDMTNKVNDSSQTSFSFNSSKLKLVKRSNKLKTQVDQFLKDTEPNDEKNENLTKNQMKKLKKQSKKGKKGKTKKGKLNQSEDEEEEKQLEEKNKQQAEDIEPNEEKKELEKDETDENENNEQSSENIEKLIIEPMKSLTFDLKNEFKLEAMKSFSFKIENPDQIKNSDSSSSSSSSSLQSCLAKFTSKEILADKLHCEKCSSLTSSSKKNNKVYTRSLKQYLICDLPAILTIHLKRFQQHGMRLEKLNKHVQFPLILDMSSFTSSQAINISKPNERILYSLYGLVEHSGKLNTGHYTACIKSSSHKTTPKQKSYLGHHRLCHLNKMLETYLQNKQKNTNEKEAIKIKQEESNEFDEKNITDTDDKWYYVSDTQVSEINIQRVLKSQAYILFYERIN